MLEKTFDPKSVEPRLYEAWESSGAFKPTDDPNAKPYCIVIPPPNVTGSLHIGHALNSTLQDVLARFHRMRGDAVLWLPGTDHAGIATQMVVERQLAAEGNEGRRELGRDKFVERVWEWKAQSGGAIARQLRRLGASCDWSRERFTLDEGLSAAVRKVFVGLHKEGLIYRDKRLVNWHPELQTAISDLEVENIEQKGSMWRFRYPLADGSSYEHPVEFDGDGKATAWETRDYVVVATTRPETMLGDAAVAVHPGDERYAALVGKQVRLPLTGRLIPIVADDYADPTKGTGAVKITPAHDFNDFQVGKRHGLALINVFTPEARINDNPDAAIPERYVGLDRFAARKRIVADMEVEGLLDGVDAHQLAVPMDEKSKSVVIEPYLTDQWYVDAAVLAKPALEAVRSGETVFSPRHWEKTYFNWLENIEPWCISRQLWWGHRIPAWYGELGDIFVAETDSEALAEAKRHYGNDVEVVLGGAGDFGAVRTNGKLTRVALRQDEDVLDTWFSSALWPFSTLGWPQETSDLERFYPTNDLVTSFDIIFFWVARMMMMGLHFKHAVPFRNVFINALVLDEKGLKMSKTRGNVIDPLELVDEYGADALRFTMAAMSGPTRTIKLSKQRVEGYRNFGTKLWNAARFCQMNECAIPAGFDPASVKETVNRWVRGEVAKAAGEVTTAIETFAFDEAAGALYRFIWNVFCDWYLELAKPILNGTDEAAKAETRAMAAWVLEQAMILLHPISPYMTEELWAATAEFGAPRPGFLMHQPWPSYPATFVDEAAAAEIDWLIELVSEVRSIRAEMNVPPSARPALAIVGAGEGTKARLTRQRDRILALARVADAKPADQAPQGSAPFPIGQATGALSIAEFIDLAAEKARLNKSIANYEGDAKRARGKLENEAFMAKAPEDVVQENRDKLAEAEGGLSKIRAALERLAAMG